MDNQASNNNPQIVWLLILLCLATILILIGLYYFLNDKPFGTTIIELIRDTITGFIGALIAYLIVYFLFIRKGISTNLKEDQEMRKEVRGVLNITSSGNIIISLANKIKQLNPPFNSDLKLYTFLGLQNETENNILQDFDMRGRNINAVQFLWADASAGNIINAKVNSNGNSNQFLHVSFINNSRAGSNVAIRLREDLAHSRPNKMRYITFDMRISKGNEQIEVAVRVVNGWLQHWHYSNGPDAFRTITLGRLCNVNAQTNFSEWISFSVDLEDSTKWHLFRSDGNYMYGPEEPDFSVITSIIFEFGAKEGGHGALSSRPGIGNGELDIGQIRLTEKSEHLI